MTKFFKWFGISIGVIFLIVVILGVLVVGIISKKTKENYMDKNMYYDDRKTVESFGNKRLAIEKGTRISNEDKIIDGQKDIFPLIEVRMKISIIKFLTFFLNSLSTLLISYVIIITVEFNSVRVCFILIIDIPSRLTF